MSMPTPPVYRPLGNSGLKVPQLWLGTMMFGDQTNEADSLSIIDATRDAGLNALDTADVYAKGESERIVGRAIARDRDRWVLATKVANQIGLRLRPGIGHRCRGCMAQGLLDGGRSSRPCCGRIGRSGRPRNHNGTAEQVFGVRSPQRGLLREARGVGVLRVEGRGPDARMRHRRTGAVVVQ